MINIAEQAGQAIILVIYQQDNAAFKIGGKADNISFKGAGYINSRAATFSVVRTAERLAINSDHLAICQNGHRLHPISKTAL